MSFENRKLGSLLVTKDSRDILASSAITTAMVQNLPRRFVHNEFPLPVFDQGKEGTCVANTLALIMIYLALKAKMKRNPSRRDIYSGARGGDRLGAEGCDPHAACQYLTNTGACEDATWHYEPGVWGNPGPNAVNERPLTKLAGYAVVDPTNQSAIKAALINSGAPLSMQIPVYKGFFSPDANHKVNNDVTDEFSGYHEIALLGFDDDLQCWIVQNSWGEDYGNKGQVLYPYRNAITSLFAVTSGIIDHLPDHVQDFLKTLFPWLFH